MTDDEEYSFGIVPLRREAGRWEVLLIKHQAGHWSFPKGHQENEERAEETAKRELFEETGLNIGKFLDQPPLKERYSFQREGGIIHKVVTYFLATVEGTVHLQEEELEDYEWMDIGDAKHKATFSEGKNICKELEKRISAMP